MVQDGTNSDVVTARILRETRNAQARARREKEEAENVKIAYLEARPVAQGGPAAVLAVPTATETQAAERYEPAVEPDVYYRRGRLGVVAVLVLVLFWAWLQQRRNMATGGV